jgi:hypothetical protein
MFMGDKILVCVLICFLHTKQAKPRNSRINLDAKPTNENVKMTPVLAEISGYIGNLLIADVEISLIWTPRQRIDKGVMCSMRKESILTASLLVIALAAFTATAYGQATINITILNPTSGGTGAKGILSNGHWVGEIPIRISGSGTPTFQTVAYCMDPDGLIYIGSTYSAFLAPSTDTSEWRAISYILSWNYPQDNTQAAVDQVAMWKLLNPGYTRQSWLEVSIYNAGISLANSASGKDVARQGDLFSWTSPIGANMSGIQANPGATITFTTLLTSSTGTPRANVKILFTAELTVSGLNQQLNSTHVTPSETFTDSQGNAQVTVHVPSDTPYGAIVEIRASTQSMWTQKYLDVSNPQAQDLVGIGSNLGMTLSTNIFLTGYLLILPEGPFAALGAIGAFAVAFVAWNKFMKPRKPTKN